MLTDIKRTNAKQHALIVDPSPHSAALCPRRAGKSYAGAATALITGEAKPDSISIIISLNLKQLRRLYWSGAPSGLFNLNRQYGLNITWNNSSLRWEHENGSIGYLMGADDDDQLEVLRGMEADLYLVDECKSFVPNRLEKLVTEIIGPQRATRQGRLILIGTPGNNLSGPFYDATAVNARDDKGRRLSVDYGAKDPSGRDTLKNRLWSRHHWTLEDNTAKRHQWTEALITKAEKGWSDDEPVWRREYLGEWTAGGDGTVYLYGTERPKGNVTWHPEVTKDNLTGLPPELGPWRLIAGLDIGFEDRTALVVAAYSAVAGELRHVFDHSQAHMVVDDVADLLRSTQERLGAIEKIYADTGNLGKMVVATLARSGFPVEAAEKREKYDFIELLNSAFTRGEVKIIPGTLLEEQLLTDAWDLEGGTREELARLGKLREDDAIPNDSVDAFLYLYRGSLHRFGVAKRVPAPQVGTPDWVRAYERDQLARARAASNAQNDRLVTHRAPNAVRNALALDQRGEWLPTPGRFKRS
jgi:hypothetical protein